MDTKISIRMPGLEIDFEGSEEFVRDELRRLVEDMAALRDQHQREDHGGYVIESDEESARRDESRRTDNDRPVVALAEELSVEPADVESAFAPDDEPPYVRVDKYYWSSFKSNTPGGGPTAISSGALVGTLLCLWFEHLNREAPTKEEIVNATAAANIKDTKIDRSMDNCGWLRVTGDRVSISPIQLQKALRVARAYCLKKPIEEEE